MIFGIGTDIADIRRVAAVFERRGERFARKVLGPTELAVFRRRAAAVPVRGLRSWRRASPPRRRSPKPSASASTSR